MLKVGVIGTGVMGNHHARVYSSMEGVELVGISDLDETRAKTIAGQYNTTPYTDYNKLFREGLDAVSIAVPTIGHKKITLDALDNGVNVLVEKPIADTISSAKEMIKKAKTQNLKLMVGHIERFNPVVQELKNWLIKGTLGDIVAMSATRVGPFTDRIKDVGVIIDICVHDIDVMSYLFNDTVTGTYATAGDSGGVLETYAQLLLKFNRGGSGIIEANRLTPRKIRKLTVTGANGVAVADYINQSLLIQNGVVISPEIEKHEPLMQELSHFVDCVRNDERPLVNGVEGMHALEVAMAAVESYKKNRFEEVSNGYHANPSGLELN